jgi:hypothetical protein
MAAKKKAKKLSKGKKLAKTENLTVAPFLKKTHI